MTKEELKKIFDKIIDYYDKYNISIEMYPEIDETINYDGKGVRTVRYIREVTIKDKNPTIEHIKKKVF